MPPSFNFGIGGLQPLDLNFGGVGAPAPMAPPTNGAAGYTPYWLTVPQQQQSAFGLKPLAPTGGPIQIDQPPLQSDQPPFQYQAPNQTMGWANTIIGGIGTLGNLGLAAWSLHNAQKDSEWMKQMAMWNYNNSLKSYNNAVADRMRARYTNDPNYTPEKIEQEIAKWSLPLPEEKA